MKRRGGSEGLTGPAKLNERTHRRLFCHGEMENGKQLLWISPNPRQAESGRQGQPSESLLRVLVGKLRNDFLPARKMKFLAAYMDGLFRLADQVHLDPPVALVVNCLVPPEREVEVRAKLVIRPHEQVQLNSAVTPARSL